MKVLPIAAAAVVIAFVTGSDSLFYLTYALIALYVLTPLWTRRALSAVHLCRRFPTHAFFGEQVKVQVDIVNTGLLPVPWMEFHESLPVALHAPNFERRVVSLASHERACVTYELHCRRRGCYRLGPANVRTGDLLGFSPDRTREFDADPFVVYPRIVPLRQIEIPSQLLFGSIASRQTVFQDPARFAGEREYVPGDSQRQIDWKNSARLDRLLVKRFQPSMALQVTVILDLNSDAYRVQHRETATEIGIIVAASLAAHLVERRQQVGLALSGADQVSGSVGVQAFRPAHGRQHLIRLLEALARTETAPTTPLAAVLPHLSAGLRWGSSVFLIVPAIDDALVAALVLLRRKGVNAMTVATDPSVPFEGFKAQLHAFGVPAFQITRVRDMDVWR